MQSTRVTMPPSKRGARPSIATAWHWVGSPVVLAPRSINARRTRPVSYGVPRIRKLSAASPQASLSQSRFAWKPPDAATKVLARTISEPPLRATTALSKRPSSMSRSRTSASYSISTPRRAAAR